MVIQVQRVNGCDEHLHTKFVVSVSDMPALFNCRFTLTDSGGIQEEAPTFKKPVLVLREKTERPEGVAAGISRLVGTDIKTIVDVTSSLLSDDKAYLSMTCAENPYGDGQAAQRIAAILAGRVPSPLRDEL